ncbi:MAG: LysR family transcriptional regulator [Paracoccaceae bacterium]
MNIEQVLTFLDLIETNSFNATAERLGVTQSTISSRVQSLEAALGKRLFARSRAGTRLTTAGARFAHHARTLQQEWNEAQRSVQSADNFARSLRIGVQMDIAPDAIGRWVQSFRKAMPDTSFYIEPDYSIQMSADLLAGGLDIGMMFAPRHFPDLHNERIGDVTYRMVSTEADRLEGVAPERYIYGNYTPAFDQAHRRLLPDHARSAPVACGQSSAVAALLLALGGSAYVLQETARDLLAGGRCRFVEDAEPIIQSVYLAVHIRHRHSQATRKILGIVRSEFGFS